MNKTITLQSIKPNNPLYEECGSLCVISKQLYNVGLYELRQTLFNHSEFLNYKVLYQQMKNNENWTALPRKISNKVWKQVTGNWSHWLKALKEYKKNPSKFTGRPRLPKYNKAMNIVTYEQGALGTRGLSENKIRLSKTNIILDTSLIKGKVKEIKIIPQKGKFIIKATYTEEMKNNKLDYNRIAGIDLGLNNLMTVATNQADIVPIMVNGRALKSINHHWNKQKAKLQSKLKKGIFNSHQINQLTEKRNNKIDTYLHVASRTVVDWLIKNNIGTLIIGKNAQWKTGIKIGKRNNQNFVQLPHARLIELVKYKFEQQNGIVVINEESYTSKASALDGDELPKFSKRSNKKPDFSGKRVKRGLYKTLQGLLINADVNGALNIIKKVAKNSLDDLVSDKQFIHHCATPKFLKLDVAYQ
ncbi:RNA-guided endonuclease InsQ/TnpB family protein [Candidatus Marithrix sp. Canyon 246]|uniref:RNA-guided endonuclease InsQ/TnpB family protein n=1 Tax=Candidatus Marithrix sp. Canyon 246 TaxID=1827136 RepID=UPI00084A064C|nr:RNA-guided endonuclease TnpB family protein [Candidatus Marithrix sp. Canyon 246]